MEALPPHTREGVPPERQLASGRNKVERIGEQTKGLFDDFTSWVELRLKLFQAEIQEKVEGKINEAVIKIAPFVSGAVAGFFGLVTLALFLGWWLGHPAWGFLCVTVLFGAITGALLIRKKRMAKGHDEKGNPPPGAVTNGESAAIS